MNSLVPEWWSVLNQTGEEINWGELKLTQTLLLKKKKVTKQSNGKGGERVRRGRGCSWNNPQCNTHVSQFLKALKMKMTEKTLLKATVGTGQLAFLKLFFPKQKQKGRGILAGSLLLYKLICILSCIDCSIAIKQIPLFLLGNHHRSNNKYRIILIYLLFFFWTTPTWWRIPFVIFHSLGFFLLFPFY